jgi:hypothetical protein
MDAPAHAQIPMIVIAQSAKVDKKKPHTPPVIAASIKKSHMVAS